MIQSGILNPHLLSLLARVRHTNTLVIADRAFPNFPQLEIVDLSLICGVPTVLQVLDALKPNFMIGKVWQAEQFITANSREIVSSFDQAFASIPNVIIERLDHDAFKKLVPGAIGLIRTGDATLYGNIIIESV